VNEGESKQGIMFGSTEAMVIIAIMTDPQKDQT